MNARLAVVFQRSAPAAELFSLGPAAPKRRGAFTPADSDGAGRGAVPVKIVENTPAGVALDVAFGVRGSKTRRLTVKLTIGQPFVETAPGANAAALWLDAPCRFAILPDFFADDIVLDAVDLPVAKAELPADHFLMHLSDDRGAIVMAVRSEAAGDVGISLSGTGEKRKVRVTSIPYGAKGRIYVGVLSAEGIWHRRDVAAGDRDKITPLGWAAPFPATWRCDWRRHDGLTDSWEMTAQRPDGRFSKLGPVGAASTLPSNRRRWTTVLGTFSYPCWLDRNGRGFLQPLKRGLRFEGPAIVYPINRARQTPLDRFTVVDVVRGTLGVGPCEYVLDVEGQKSISKGIATCGARSTLNAIYQKGQQARQQAKIEKTLKDVVIFIKFIRRRIEEYVAFGHEMRQYFDAQRQAHPGLAKHLDELDALAREIDKRFAAREGKIKTPADAERLADEFRRTMLNYEGPDALKKCHYFTMAWVAIGANQDELVGECRMAVKVLRQRASILVAHEPKLTAVAREIRRRSQQVLRNPAGHEGARH
jgi:hypothetical protein